MVKSARAKSSNLTFTNKPKLGSFTLINIKNA